MYFEHPHPRTVIAQEMQCFPPPRPKLPSLQHCKCTARSLQFDTAGANAVGIRMGKGWARQGHLAIEHCRDTVWAHCRDALPWALQGYSAVGRCRNTLQ